MSTVAEIHSRGLRSAQPAASAVGIGTLYFVTDENITERSSGSAWQSYSGPAASGSTTIQTLQILREETITEESVPIPGPAGSGSGGTGKVVQIVNTQTGAVATGTTIIPHDDTIPQITEGDEYMTLAITPTSSSNKLKVDVVVYVSATNASEWLCAALFQDSTANALAAGTIFDATATAVMNIHFTHYMTAGTTSSTTFRIRAGRDSAGTTTFNGQSGGRLLGGVMASSITISEIVP